MIDYPIKIIECQSMTDYPLILAECQSIADDTGEVSYIVGSTRIEPHVMTSAHFTPIAYRARYNYGLSIIGARWPEERRYGNT